MLEGKRLYVFFPCSLLLICVKELSLQLNRIMMKHRRLISWFLMLVSIVMLTASVLPHHHHHGRICLQHDLTENASCTSSSQNQDNGSSCKVCCVTRFKCSVPSNHDYVQPHFTHVVTLFTEAIIFELFTPIAQTHQYNSYYYESLHSTRITRSIGLRAPPCMA